MRHDSVEKNPANSFLHRIDRIDTLVRKWYTIYQKNLNVIYYIIFNRHPLIVGLQEPFKSQIARLKEKLPQVNYNWREQIIKFTNWYSNTNQ